MLSQAEGFVGDYLGSESLLFLNAAVKEHAEGALRAFFQAAQKRGAEKLDDLKAKTVETVLLEDMGRLALPAPAKRALPDLLAGFFGYLQNSGRFPPAGEWRARVEAAEEKFHASLRADGSVKGETFKKNYTDVGRNDPCPCGSGKKFKKCCGPLIGL